MKHVHVLRVCACVSVRVSVCVELVRMGEPSSEVTRHCPDIQQHHVFYRVLASATFDRVTVAVALVHVWGA